MCVGGRQNFHAESCSTQCINVWRVWRVCIWWGGVEGLGGVHHVTLPPPCRLASLTLHPIPPPPPTHTFVQASGPGGFVVESDGIRLCSLGEGECVSVQESPFPLPFYLPHGHDAPGDADRLWLKDVQQILHWSRAQVGPGLSHACVPVMDEEAVWWVPCALVAVVLVVGGSQMSILCPLTLCSFVCRGSQARQPPPP